MNNSGITLLAVAYRRRLKPSYRPVQRIRLLDKRNQKSSHSILQASRRAICDK